MQSNVTAAVKIAEQFGNLIAKGNYWSAHALLTLEAQKIHSPHHFRWAIEEMVGHRPGVIQRVEVSDDFILEVWPAKQDGDIVSVYVGLIGDGFVEAITVILVGEPGAIRIRKLEWGQP